MRPMMRPQMQMNQQQMLMHQQQQSAMMRQRMMQQQQHQQQLKQQLQPQTMQQQQQMLQPQQQQHQQQQQQQPPGSEDTTSNDAYSSEVLTKPNGGIGIKIKIKKAAEPSDKSSNVKKAKHDEESTLPIQQSSELQNSHTAGQTVVDTRPQKSQQSAAQSEGPIRENNQSPAQSQQRHSTGQPFLTQHAQMTSKQKQSNQQEQQPQQQQQQPPHQSQQQSQQQPQQQQQQPQQLPPP